MTTATDFPADHIFMIAREVQEQGRTAQLKERGSLMTGICKDLAEIMQGEYAHQRFVRGLDGYAAFKESGRVMDALVEHMKESGYQAYENAHLQAENP